MTRSKAFTLHLLGTLLVLLILTLVARLAWYPDYFWLGLGAPDMLFFAALILLGVGPLLTIILFKPGKRGLQFDIWMIGGLQLLALVATLWFMHQNRPVFVVFVVDIFEVVQANEVSLEAAKHEQFKRLPITQPRFAVGKLPTDPEERSELIFSALGGRGDVHNFAKYFQPYQPPFTDAVGDRSQPLKRLLERHQAAPEMLAWMADGSDYGFVPMKMRKRDMSAIVSLQSGEVVEVLPIDPWVR